MTASYARILLVAALMLAGLTQAGCRDSVTDADDDPSNRGDTIELDEQVEIAFGETVKLKDTDLEISFTYVAEDSRCASDVVCVTAGRARIVLTVSDSPGTEERIEVAIPGLVETPHQISVANQFKEWSFRLLRLNPYPVTTTPTGNEDYTAMIVVESLLD